MSICLFANLSFWKFIYMRINQFLYQCACIWLDVSCVRLQCVILSNLSRCQGADAAWYTSQNINDLLYLSKIDIQEIISAQLSYLTLKKLAHWLFRIKFHDFWQKYYIQFWKLIMKIPHATYTYIMSQHQLTWIMTTNATDMISYGSVLLVWGSTSHRFLSNNLLMNKKIYANSINITNSNSRCIF